MVISPESSRLWNSHLIDRRAGSHEIWFRPATNRYTTVPNHPGDMPEGTLRAILRQADIDPETFLSA
jgi:predicted RNA binding protein YcfA (HicA-like mRNA interferase family)